MAMFDWSNMNILSAVRMLCGKLVLKGETQQVDRIVDAFSRRWCECNPNHGLKSAGTHYTDPNLSCGFISGHFANMT